MAFVLKISLDGDLRRISVPDYSAFTFTALSETLLALFGDSMPKHYTVQYIDDEGDQIVVSSDDELREGFRVAAEDNRKSLRIEITPSSSAPQLDVVIPPPPCVRQQSADLDTPPVSPRELTRELVLEQTATLEDTLEREREIKKDLETKEPKSEQSNEETKDANPWTPHFEPEKVVHKHVICDGCGMNPIRGTRYKSSVVEDFDLCDACEEEGKFEDSHAPFLKINTPNKAPKTIVTIIGADAPNWRQHPRCGSGAGRWAGGRARCGRRREKRAEKQAEKQAQASKSQGERQPSNDDPALQAALIESLLPQAVHPTPAPTVEVKNNANIRPMARFVTDVTIPDGTKLSPGEKFVKTWTMRNDGKGNWPVGSRLMSVGGDNMTVGTTAKEGVLVVPACREILPGQQVEVSIELQAPSKPGRYVGHFRMQAGGHRFGHRVWADIIVVMPEEVKKETEEVVTEPIQDEMRMSITPDVALAVSAKLQELSTPVVSVPTTADQQQQEPITSTQRMVAAGNASPSFVMVDPLPETLLVPDMGDQTAEQSQSDSSYSLSGADIPVSAPPAVSAPVVGIPASTLIDAAINSSQSEQTTKTEEEPHRWATQMTNLADMGFFDQEHLSSLLDETNGDVQRVIERLLS